MRYKLWLEYVRLIETLIAMIAGAIVALISVLGW